MFLARLLLWGRSFGGGRLGAIAHTKKRAAVFGGPLPFAIPDFISAALP